MSQKATRSHKGRPLSEAHKAALRAGHAARKARKLLLLAQAEDELRITNVNVGP